MTKPYLELVGLLVVNARTVGMYHIDYCYKFNVSGRLEGTGVQKGFDWDLHERFECIVDHLTAAYAPALKKRWTRSAPKVDQVYLQLVDGHGPHQVGLFGKWVLDIEW